MPFKFLKSPFYKISKGLLVPETHFTKISGLFLIKKKVHKVRNGHARITQSAFYYYENKNVQNCKL